MNKKEPDPIKNNSITIWDLVVEDMQERNKIGIEKYNTPLQAFNGRNSLVDLYQELLDASVYIRKKIEEDKNLNDSYREFEKATDECLEYYCQQIDILKNCLIKITKIAPESTLYNQIAKKALKKVKKMSLCKIHNKQYNKCGC